METITEQIDARDNYLNGVVWCHQGKKQVDKKLGRSTSHAKGSYRIITLYKIITWCRFKNE